MNCLSYKEIQEIIDREGEDMALKHEHLLQCDNCTERLRQQQGFMQQMMHDYNRAFEPVSVPEFVAPVRTPASRRRTIRWAASLTAVAAAFTLAWILFKPAEDKPSIGNGDFVFYQADFDIDANKPISEQPLEIIVYEGKNISGEIHVNSSKL